jgi:hypothetical protein
VGQPGRFVVLPLDNTARTPLRAGEDLRWEMPAQRMTLMTLPGGIPSWNREGQGMLTLSSERVFFTAPGQHLWQTSLYEIERVEVYPSSVGSNIMELFSASFKQRTSFEVVEMPWTLVMDGSVVELSMTPKDVAGILRALIERS